MYWNSFPCLVIHNKDECKRKENILNECKKVSLNPIFIDAVMIKNNPVKGCLQSHLKCIQYAKKMNYDKVLILEDDVIFNDKLPSKIPNNFDIFYLGYNATSGYRYKSSLLKFNGVFCAHSYIVHSNIYDLIINDLSSNWWDKIKINELNNYEKQFNWNLHAIDQYYSKVLSKRNKLFGIYPMIAYQRPSFSTIENKNVDYTNVMKSNMDYISKKYQIIQFFNPSLKHKKIIEPFSEYFKVYIYYKNKDNFFYNKSKKNIEEYTFQDLINIQNKYLIIFNNLDYFMNLYNNVHNIYLFIDDMTNIKKSYKEGKPLLFNISKCISKIITDDEKIFNILINEYDIDSNCIFNLNYIKNENNRFIINYDNYKEVLEWYYHLKSNINKLEMEVVKMNKYSKDDIKKKMMKCKFYVKTKDDEKWIKLAKENKLITISKENTLEQIKKLIKLKSKKKMDLFKYVLS